MHQTYNYPAIFDRQGDEIIVRFPDIPEALTGADTLDEARTLAADALQEAILAYLADGRPIPAPRPARAGEEGVPLDPVTAGRAAVSQMMVEQKLTRVALAERMKSDEKVVRRILDGRGRIQMATVMAALRALGVRPTLAV